ncbi:hypothetical protein ACB094_10G040100 [Castanea mollissima]
MCFSPAGTSSDLIFLSSLELFAASSGCMGLVSVGGSSVLFFSSSLELMGLFGSISFAGSFAAFSSASFAAFSSASFAAFTSSSDLIFPIIAAANGRPAHFFRNSFCSGSLFNSCISIMSL